MPIVVHGPSDEGALPAALDMSESTAEPDSSVKTRKLWHSNPDEKQSFFCCWCFFFFFKLGMCQARDL